MSIITQLLHLNEANIYNTKTEYNGVSIASFIDQLLSGHVSLERHDEKLDKLYRKKMAKLLSMEDSALEKVKNLPDDAPDWAKSSDDLVAFRPNPTVVEQSKEIASFLISCHNSIDDPDEEISYASEKAITSFSTVSNLVEAYEITKKYYKKVSAIYKKNNKDDDLDEVERKKKMFEGTEKVFETGGFTFYKLTSQEAYKREGAALGNCIGRDYTYEDSLESDYEIVIMKRPDGETCVGMHIYHGDTLAEVKGKTNAPPVDRYVPHVMSYITNEGFEVGDADSDIVAMGYVKDGDAYVHFSKNYDSFEEYFADKYFSSLGDIAHVEYFHGGKIVVSNTTSIEEVIMYLVEQHGVDDKYNTFTDGVTNEVWDKNYSLGEIELMFNDMYESTYFVYVKTDTFELLYDDHNQKLKIHGSLTKQEYDDLVLNVSHDSDYNINLVENTNLHKFINRVGNKLDTGSHPHDAYCRLFWNDDATHGEYSNLTINDMHNNKLIGGAKISHGKISDEDKQNFGIIEFKVDYDEDEGRYVHNIDDNKNSGVQGKNIIPLLEKTRARIEDVYVNNHDYIDTIRGVVKYVANELGFFINSDKLNENGLIYAQKNNGDSFIETVDHTIHKKLKFSDQFDLTKYNTVNAKREAMRAICCSEIGLSSSEKNLKDSLASNTKGNIDIFNTYIDKDVDGFLLVSPTEENRNRHKIICSYRSGEIVDISNIHRYANACWKKISSAAKEANLKFSHDLEAKIFEKNGCDVFIHDNTASNVKKFVKKNYDERVKNLIENRVLRSTNFKTSFNFEVRIKDVISNETTSYSRPRKKTITNEVIGEFRCPPIMVYGKFTIEIDADKKVYSVVNMNIDDFDRIRDTLSREIILAIIKKHIISPEFKQVNNRTCILNNERSLKIHQEKLNSGFILGVGDGDVFDATLAIMANIGLVDSVQSRQFTPAVHASTTPEQIQVIIAKHIH